MKIALLTIWHEKNYGAELQAYATIRLLQNLGHEVNMIDVRLDDCRNFNINGKIGKILELITPSYHQFNTFWKKFIPKTIHYKTQKQLFENPPIADIYAVGSDQVWNPDITLSYSKLFFLNFGPKNVRKLSIASSFGTESWNHHEQTKEIQQLLKDFNYITCRENSGVKILTDIFGVEAQNMLDPTLLLSDYKELIGNVCDKQTLVYYPLDKDPELDELCSKISKELALTLINNKKCSYLIGKVEWNRVSIEEWIKNIAQSKFVITRSFHGLVFSLLFNKDFAIIAGKNGRSTRLQSLLEQVGLTNRFFNSTEELYLSKPWLDKINYSPVNEKLETLRQQSFTILSEMLK